MLTEAKEELRNNAEKSIRATYYHMGLSYIMSAKRLLILSTVMAVLAGISIAGASVCIFRFGMGRGIADRICLIYCMTAFTVVTPKVFKTLRLKTDDLEFSPKFYIMLTSSFLCACAVVITVNAVSIPFLAIPLLFTTLREEKWETFCGTVNKAGVCREQYETFHLTMNRLDELLSGGEYIAEEDMFRIRLEQAYAGEEPDR